MKNQELQPLQTKGMFKIPKKKLIEIISATQNRSFDEEIELLIDYKGFLIYNKQIGFNFYLFSLNHNIYFKI